MRAEVMRGGEGLPPGQKAIPNFIIYRILGQPDVDVVKWRLRVGGEVSSPTTYTYEELLEMSSMSYVSDFHCVTGWSVRNVAWEGIPLRRLISEVNPSKEVSWVFVRSLDNYTTVIPYSDFNDERAILALKVNGRPLSVEQGFPARIFIPHLYGWKSAKWVTEIIFTREYKDGYWEALGYHERGNAWSEERFKS
ncbi:MAG: sulfite oxidase-like oxidoreductase [Zestosphaera sp.]